VKIEPLIWSEDEKLLVAFSTMQKGLYPDDIIPGINVGLNTAEDQKRVWQKRALFLNKLGIPVSNVVFARQIHSATVHYVTDPGTVDGVDGFITDRPGLALAIQVADCAAVFIADRSRGVIGAIHAGWKGAASGIIINAVSMMQSKGAEPENMQAWISPCIGAGRFEVGEEVAELFPPEFVLRAGFEKPHIDLKAYVRSQLLQCGLEGDQIYTDPGCTYNDSEVFYSYRRDRERAGRMMGLVMMR
jgi:polyphenol oxidase